MAVGAVACKIQSGQPLLLSVILVVLSRVLSLQMKHFVSPSGLSLASLFSFFFPQHDITMLYA